MKAGFTQSLSPSQFGGSTWIQGYMMKKAITRRNRKILDVAHNMDTGLSLFTMGRGMYDRLPEEIKPDLVGKATPTRGRGVLHFGIAGAGKGSGLNSIIQIDTAQEVAAGRGQTFTDLHLSECAHWQDSQKALGLMPAVPKRPGTSIFLESTANGLNWFHQR